MPIIVRESFAMPFGGSQIFSMESDGLCDHSDLVMEKFRRDLAILRRPSAPSQIGIHLKDTVVTRDMAKSMLDEMNAPGMHIQKAAVVGLLTRAKRIWQRLMKEMEPPPRFVCAYFDDYEKAKEWLVC